MASLTEAPHHFKWSFQFVIFLTCCRILSEAHVKPNLVLWCMLREFPHRDPTPSFATKPGCLFSILPLGILHNPMISLSSRDREAETQNCIVSIQMVDLKQRWECSFKNSLELYFCTGVYFALSHLLVSEAPILTEFKTQVNVQLV